LILKLLAAGRRKKRRGKKQKKNGNEKHLLSHYLPVLLFLLDINGGIVLLVSFMAVSMGAGLNLAALC